MKIAINTCHGGFSLSEKAMRRYAELAGFTLVVVGEDWRTCYYKNAEAEDNYFSARDLERNDPALIQVLEELGQEANGRFSELKVVEIPDDVKWEIKEYDGMEWVAEVHRTWS